MELTIIITNTLKKIRKKKKKFNFYLLKAFDYCLMLSSISGGKNPFYSKKKVFLTPNFKIFNQVKLLMLKNFVL